MKPLRGLYAITSDSVCRDSEGLRQAVAAALTGGAQWVQYRDKTATPDQRRTRATALARLCRQTGTGLIINDDVALALAVGADGVHVGAADGDLAQIREALGADRVLGVTCGDDLLRARQAVTAGANYVAFGRLYPSRTKPDAPPARLTTLRRAAGTLPVAVCGIGGITPEHAATVAEHGATLIAVVDGLFGAADIHAAARRYLEALAPYNLGTS